MRRARCVRKVVLDVKVRPDLLRRLALDHVRYGLARQIQQCFDVQVICGQDKVKEGPLVNINKLLVPLILGILRETHAKTL